ncbi:MAG: 5-methyltetrahydropteroyltriglutamate--homocysteine methyltransferase, partial [Acidimicrobiia bacterium]|nr:5-methyltetrahydropteroyltriglutamate--homocysteine methyltransferase [Acidimicrobiia bacterium]
YQTDRELGAALAIALNVEVRRLADVGCTQIQVDEPVMARYPQVATEWGIELLAEVFAGLPDEVTRTVHICCGYPDRLDAAGYPKADPAAYQALLPLLDAAPSVDVLSIEDAHRHNDLAVLETLERTILALGSLRIASSTVERADDIARRVETVLGAISPERLVLAPDCGLGMLPRSVAVAKLEALRQTADLF